MLDQKGDPAAVEHLKIAPLGNDPVAKESAQQALQRLGKGIVKK